MQRSSEAAWKRAIEIQEVILRAMAKRITLWQERQKSSGSATRNLRRWKKR
jgi:hypothetical protein